MNKHDRKCETAKFTRKYDVCDDDNDNNEDKIGYVYREWDGDVARIIYTINYKIYVRCSMNIGTIDEIIRSMNGNDL